MKWWTFVFVVASAFLWGNGSRCCRADITQYGSSGTLTLTIKRFTDAGGVTIDRPDGLVLSGDAEIDEGWREATATGSGSAFTTPSVEIVGSDQDDLQLDESVMLRASVNGQAGPEVGSSYASAYVTGGVYLDNFEGSSDCYVLFDLDWEYEVFGPARVEIVLADLESILADLSLFDRFVPDGGWPWVDEGTESFQVWVPAGTFNQAIISVLAEGQADVAPVPLPGAALLAVLGLGTARWRLRRSRGAGRDGR